MWPNVQIRVKRWLVKQYPEATQIAKDVSSHLTRLGQQKKLKEGLIVGLVLVILPSTFFFPVLFLDKILLGADTLFELPPWQSLAEPGFKASSTLASDALDNYAYLTFVIEEIKQGNLFPWNPYGASGQPFYFLTFQLLLYPINWLFLIFPVEKALGYHAFLRLMTAGVFTYLFARRVGLKTAGGLIAAIVQMFNGFMIVWLGWPHTYVMAVLPLNLWLVDKLLTKVKLSTAIVLSFAILFLFTGGFLPVTAYSLGLLTFYTVFKLAKDYYSHRKFNLFWSKGLIYLSAVGGGVALAAVYIMPIIHSLTQSGYTAERASDTQLYRFYHFPIQHIITYLIPGYYGDNLTDGFWGVGNYIESTGYVGILPLLLVPFSFIDPKQRRLAWFFLSVLAISMGIIYGFPPLQWLISNLPGFNILLNTRLLSINAFALAILAGLGADFLTRQPVADCSKKRKKAWIATIGGALLLCLLVITIEGYWDSIPNRLIDYGENGNPFGASIVVKKTFYSALLARDIIHAKRGLLFGLWLGLSLTLVCLYLKKIISINLFKVTVVGLTIVDLFSFGISFNVALDPAYLFPKTPSIEMLQTDYRVNPFQFLALDRVFFGSTSMIYKLPNVGGHSITHPERYTHFLRRINPDVWDRRKHGTLLYFSQESTNLDSNLINFLNIKYVLQGKEDCRLEGRNIDVSQTISSVPVGEIWGEQEVGQTFQVTQDNFFQICLRVATYRRANNRDLIFHLKESPDSETDLVTQRVNTAQFLDNSWYPFTFPPITDSANKTFYFSVESPTSEPGNAITIWASSEDIYAEGSRYNGKNIVDGDLAFLTYTVTERVARSRYTVTHNSDLIIYENKDYLPKAYFAPQAIILRDEEAILDNLASEEFNPYQQVILEETPTSLSENNNDVEPVPVDLVTYKPNYVHLHVNAPVGGFVILGDLYHPDWIALVDGQHSKIYLANYLFRAVYVSPGSHNLEFIFKPDLLGARGYISLTTFTILLFLSALYFLRGRQPTTIEEHDLRNL